MLKYLLIPLPQFRPWDMPGLGNPFIQVFIWAVQASLIDKFFLVSRYRKQGKLIACFIIIKV